MASAADDAIRRINGLACREHLLGILKNSGSPDATAAADRLIEEWGSLPAILSASEARLLSVCQDNTVVEAVRRFRGAVRHTLRTRIAERPIISSTRALFSYLSLDLAYRSAEQLRVLYLTGDNRLIRDEVASLGTLSECKNYPREIIKRALELGAANLILAHNHPSGRPEPSRSDISFTKSLRAIAAPLDICILDHVVVGIEGCISMQQSGVYNPKDR